MATRERSSVFSTSSAAWRPAASGIEAATAASRSRRIRSKSKLNASSGFGTLSIHWPSWAWGGEPSLGRMMSASAWLTALLSAARTIA